MWLCYLLSHNTRSLVLSFQYLFSLNSQLVELQHNKHAADVKRSRRMPAHALFVFTACLTARLLSCAFIAEHYTAPNTAANSDVYRPTQRSGQEESAAMVVAPCVMQEERVCQTSSPA